MDSKCYRKCLLFLGWLLIQQTTYAEPKTIGDLVEIQSETVIYRAKKERAKALSELNSLTRMAGETTHSSSHWPVIRTVQGKKPDLQATLRYPDGSEMTVKSGDPLPNGMIMGPITAKAITLVNSSTGQTIRLGFSSITPSLTAPSGDSHQ